MIIINTERLVIRKATLSDDAFILKLLNQKSFIDNIADKKVYTLADAQNYIQGAFLDPYMQGLKAPFIVTLQDGTAIGVAGFYQRPVFKEPDLGYAFLDEFTGKGYASEAANALLKFAKDNLQLDTVLAITSLTNEASIKLLRFCGFDFKQTIELEPAVVSNLYEIHF
ncbi:N-acetyltransferase GCN5 [Pseudoalteromonas sp. A25]|uniref:GNAT family N-acetyltransferase n=1 Tax=Pseudoalteromonas sp. A25 TaxID=116092 RepID=UPI0012608D89|nr:GNAT family N-acetyltransferase [Pseudoalteromonas sp. A25]BBN83409.1 N-acetyltransferase GCN5 [Pseudoalteromonas sp. A25]